MEEILKNKIKSDKKLEAFLMAEIMFAIRDLKETNCQNDGHNWLSRLDAFIKSN